jgi:WD40 repeat protein
MSYESTVVEAFELSVVDSENPWAGLASFYENDASFFHGRDEEIEELAKRIDHEGVTILHGQSGLGKTSLLRAGVFPRLRKKGAFPIYIRLQYDLGVPNPNEQVFEAIFQQAIVPKVEVPDREVDEKNLWEYLHRQKLEFWDAQNRLVTPVLVFDQFEELFTHHRLAGTRWGREHVIEMLACLIEGGPPKETRERLVKLPDLSRRFAFNRNPYKVVLSLRSDYVSQLEDLEDIIPSLVFNRMSLRPMNRVQARSAVLDPGFRAEDNRRLVDEKVAEEIVKFVAGKGETGNADDETNMVEPAILSLVCRELNNRRIKDKQPQVSLSAFEQDREKILWDFYLKCVKPLTPEACRFIEERLISEHGYRQPVHLDSFIEAPGLNQDVLDKLVTKRLLRVERQGRRQFVELTHDVLTRTVRESRQGRREKEQIAAREDAELRAKNALCLNWILAGVAALALFAFLVAGGLWIQASQATKTAENATEETKIALKEKEQALEDKQKAYDTLDLNKRDVTYRLGLDQALQIMSGRDAYGQALTFLARAFDANPSSTAARTLLPQTILYRSWPMPILIANPEDQPVKDMRSSSTHLVTLFRDGSARVFEAVTGEVLGPPLRLAAPLKVAGVGSEARWVAAVSATRELVIWRRSGDKLEEERRIALPGHDSITEIAIDSKLARLVAVAGKEAYLLPLGTDKTATPLKTLAHNDPINWVEINPDHGLILTASDDGTARLWKAKDGESKSKFDHGGKVLVARFSRGTDQLRVITVSGQTAKLWRVQSSTLAHTITHQNRIAFADFSDDGRWILTASWDKTVQRWDGWKPKQALFKLRLDNRPSFAQFGHDGTSIIVQTWDGVTTIYDGCSGKPLLEPITGVDYNLRLRFSPDGIGLWGLTSGKNKQAVKWDMRLGKARPVVLSHAGPVLAARFDLARMTLITAAGADIERTNPAWGTTQRWDLLTAKPQGEPLRHGAIVNSIDMLSDGTLLTGSKDRFARVWRPNEPEPHLTPRQGGQIFSAKFDSTGRRFVTADGSGVAQVWQTDPINPIGAQMQHDGAVYHAEFSPDPEGLWILTASKDCTARIFDAATGLARRWRRDDGAEPEAIFRHTPGAGATRCEVVRARFSSDGKYVATASWDNTARIWDAKNGDSISDPLSHNHYVVVAMFAADGKRLLTASYDGTARLWNVPDGFALGGA